jgi:5-methylcytosine-specific restriction endonuclease McrA
MNDNARFNLFNILPAIIITIAICIIEKNPVAIVSFLFVYPIWGFLQLSISERISFFNDERKKQSKLLTGLNISKTKWRKFSDLEKENHRKIYWRQENLKRKITNKRYPRDVDYSEYKLDNIIGESNNEWLNFSIEERIKFMDNYEVKEKKEAEILYKIRYKNAGIKYEKERETKRLKKIEDEKLKKIQDNENQIRLRKERELARLREEKERELKEKEEHEKEKEKQLEEIKKKQLLEERKRREKERYKEYYKRQQREKEKRRHWASEAIEEMIESGEIDDNYSSDRKRTIPGNIKEIVYVRDKGCCVTCGSKENIEYDHIIPFSKGGSNSVNNIQLLCLKCNRGKSNKIM